MPAITVASFLAAAQHLAKVAPPGALISVPDDFGTLQVTDADGRPVGDVNLALALDRQFNHIKAEPEPAEDPLAVRERELARLRIRARWGDDALDVPR